MSETLQFVFKGSRNYVHGTSIFNALIQAACQRGLVNGKIDLSFKHMIHNPLCILEERSPSSDDFVVAKVSGNKGERFVLCIKESSETKEADRHEFNENEVCRDSVVSDKKIVQYNPHHPNRIELLVSLCKKMHLECVDDTKKWVFSRYNGQFPIPKPQKVELCIIKQIGSRMTCNDVLINDQKIAEIYFSSYA
jgi:hypothetical protein